MYKTQLINLLRELMLASIQSYNFQRLLKDSQYRKIRLASAQTENSEKVSTLVKQIQIVEVLLNDSFQTNQTEPNTIDKHREKQRFGLSVLAFCGLAFISISILVVEEIKQLRSLGINRHNSSIN